MTHSSDEPVLARVTFRMTAADLAAAQRANLRWRFKQPRIYVVPVIFAALAIIWAADANPDLPPLGLVEDGAGVFAFFGLVYAMIYAAAPWGARRTYRQQKSLQEEWHVEMTRHGVRAFTPSLDATVAWSHYLAWSRDDKVILLYQSDRLFQMMPTRASTPDSSRVFQQFAGHLPRR